MSIANPSIFLPRLPRSQTSLEPLLVNDILAHIAVLKELYLPPVQGGFTAQDFELPSTETPTVSLPGVPKVGGGGESGPRPRARTLSGGSVDLAPPAGLGLEGLSVADIAEDEEEEDDDEEQNRHDHLSSSVPTRSFKPDPISVPVTSNFRDEQRLEPEMSQPDQDDAGHLDPFEREWAEKWLGGIVRRAQGQLEECGEDEEKSKVFELETILREATAVLAMMAGTSAAGSLTRHLLFPIAPYLAPALFSSSNSLSIPINPALSPETTNFLTSLSTSPHSPSIMFRPLPLPSGSSEMTKGFSHSSSGSISRRRRGSSSSTHQHHALHSHISRSPTTAMSTCPRKRNRRPAAVPVLLHDAPMSDVDHLGVGMQTWGSAILLGREMALRPADFGLLPPEILTSPQLPSSSSLPGTRVLELGAGTGLLSILCRKMLDLYATGVSLAAEDEKRPWHRPWGQVVATDFLPSVLDNLKICIDLNFPPALPDNPRSSSQACTTIEAEPISSTVHVAKLDWVTFHQYMESRHSSRGTVHQGKEWEGEEEELIKYLDRDGPFDLVLASDCVYDMTHANLLRKVAPWVIRLPDPTIPGDIGGTMHLLSPLRPTFAPELESIDAHFVPLNTLPPLDSRVGIPEGGEGLGRDRGLIIGVRGEGKRSVQGRRGEGRSDEAGGYWWWEIGWG